ncbi:hypothetical protein PRIPAC_97691 [Pristionchus pacificus]|uniref:DDE Tnp4 domain-containing protein n=1 Tax=Pristionchus pacificus TaxID=54126 RepID=A0A2A6CUS4_PRIPA|nr:hypothetical protein PRIPAC_97691 [Pristionchus pacificus]|eukprot:PDM81909.1 hypothetical protein PRIPAC_34063 [Pristionchus pacificus]
MLALARRRQQNQGYRRIHHVLMPNAQIFRGKFKFTKAAVNELVQIVDPYLTPPNQNGLAITKTDQVLIFLSSLGTNSFQSIICDRFGCSQQTVSNIIEQLLHAFTDPHVVERFIQFPIENAAWRRRTARDFSRLAGLRNVVGAVDGTLIPIQTPPNSNNLYRCRKQFAALNTTFIVDSWGRILYCNPRYPGNTHDSHVFEASTARQRINMLTCPEGYALIGDSAYRNDGRMMTPLARPRTPQEKRFNRMHCKTRVIVEQVYGMLKRRFPALTSRLRYSAEKNARMILAAAVLWNFGLDRGHGVQRGRGPVNFTYPIPLASRNVRNSVVASL